MCGRVDGDDAGGEGERGPAHGAGLGHVEDPWVQAGPAEEMSAPCADGVLGQLEADVASPGGKHIIRIRHTLGVLRTCTAAAV